MTPPCDPLVFDEDPRERYLNVKCMKCGRPLLDHAWRVEEGIEA